MDRALGNPLGNPLALLRGGESSVSAVGQIVVSVDTPPRGEWLPLDGGAWDERIFTVGKIFADIDLPTKLPNPSQLPASTGRGCAFSPDGSYLSVAHSTTPFVTVYKRDGDTFTKLPAPFQLPASTAYSCAFSPDGSYLSVAHSTTPLVTVYKRNGDTFTKIADPSRLPAGGGHGCAFSPDGGYLSVAHFTSPFVTIYKGNSPYFPVAAPNKARVRVG